MTAYDIAAWTDFANTVAGGAAALAGLLFVGLSLNLAEVLKYPGVPARAAVTLGLTIAILLTAIFVATPGQDPRVLAAEVGVVGLASAVGVIVGLRHQRSGQHRGACDDVDAATRNPGAAADRSGCFAVAAARRRSLLGNCSCRNGFRVCDRQRVGAFSRDQALTLRVPSGHAPRRPPRQPTRARRAGPDR